MKYFFVALKHKWYVFLAGLKTGAPLWRLVVHDLSKFLPSELPHYNRQYYGKADDLEGYAATWCKHQNRNPHHWEYWIPRTGSPGFPDNMPIPMPEWAVREMVADWMGAAKAYQGAWPVAGKWTWFEQNHYKLKLHPHTWEILLRVLVECGLLGNVKVTDV